MADDALPKNLRQKPQLHRDWIDPHALGIVRALQRKGHKTYLVGGCVRDLILGHEPKDFDIATSAFPNEVRRVIPHSYVIGKRFRLVLVKRDSEQYEVATFRRDLKEDESREELNIEGDNLFGTPEEDAQRRDFTINGLFYDPVEDRLIDYCEAGPDLEDRWIRMIGDPWARLKEDPIRILRAIRLAHKLDFSLVPELRQAIQETASDLSLTVLPRRREEFLKILRLKDPSLCFLELYDLGILQQISPQLHQLLSDSEKGERFLHSLSQIHSFPLDSQNPVELFGHLLYSVVRASLDPEASQQFHSKEILEHPELAPLMREQMGLFKHEQSLIAKALHMEPLLKKRADFEKRGERRKMALLTAEGFPLALGLAQKDYLLSPSDMHFWLQNYWSAQPQIEEKRELEKSQRRPRRPRRRKTKDKAPIEQ